MKKIVVSKKYLSSIYRRERFVDAIQLTRILGALRYYTILNTIINADGNLKTNLKAYFFLNHQALLYEGIKKLNSIKSEIENLDYYRNNKDKFNTIFEEWNNPSSFTNIAMKGIRNKIAFHFDNKVVRDVLKEYVEDCIKADREVVLIQGESEAVRDTYYELADNMNINYALKGINGGAASSEDKFRQMAQRFFPLMNMVCDVLEGLLVELALPYCEAKED